MIYYVDAYADRTIPDFDRYAIRCASEEVARGIMESELATVDKLEIEPAPAAVERMLEGVPDDTPVLISPDNGARFIDAG